MGTKERKEREKELRRNQILDAAKEIFMSKDFQSATMEDIANKVELSPGTLYTYFKNKEELYVSLLLGGLRVLHSQGERIFNNKKLSPEEKIVKFKDAMYKNFSNDPLLFRAIFHIQLGNSLLNLDKELLGQLDHLSRSIAYFMAEIYEDGVREGKFRENRGVALADIFWGTFTGLVAWEEGKQKIKTRKNYLKSNLDKAFDIFLRGIRKD
jgi:AcrR family transcriptional regulator